jgi:hypothetical protein
LRSAPTPLGPILKSVPTLGATLYNVKAESNEGLVLQEGNFDLEKQHGLKIFHSIN